LHNCDQQQKVTTVAHTHTYWSSPEVPVILARL